MTSALSDVPGILRAVTDPFSLLALIVIVLGVVAWPILRKTTPKEGRLSPALIGLMIVTSALVALALNVIRIVSIRPNERIATENRYIVQVDFRGMRSNEERISVPFSNSSGQLSVGCTDTATTTVQWNVPPHSVGPPNATAAWTNSDNLKNQDQQVTISGDSESGYIVVAHGTIVGQDRQWTGNCPGGGHGQLTLSGSYTMIQEGGKELVELGSYRDTIIGGVKKTYKLPFSESATLVSCRIRATSIGTNFEGTLDLGIAGRTKDSVKITDRTPDKSSIDADIVSGELQVSLP